MSLHPATREVVDEAYLAADRCLASLIESRAAIARHFPLTADGLAEITDPDEIVIDAFLKRFENLVEVGQRRLFRAAMITGEEEHDGMSARELRERLGRIGLLASPDDWKTIADTRHRTAHVYPIGDARTAEVLNEAFQRSGRAVELISGMLDGLRRRFPDAPPPGGRT